MQINRRGTIRLGAIGLASFALRRLVFVSPLESAIVVTSEIRRPGCGSGPFADEACFPQIPSPFADDVPAGIIARVDLLLAKATLRGDSTLLSSKAHKGHLKRIARWRNRATFDSFYYHPDIVALRAQLEQMGYRSTVYIQKA